MHNIGNNGYSIKNRLQLSLQIYGYKTYGLFLTENGRQQRRSMVWGAK